MKEESRQSLFASPLLRVYTVACHRPGHEFSCEECKAEHQISIPLCGVNVKQVEGEILTVSPAQVSLSNRGEVYRIGHPYGSGEVMLNIILREDALAQAVRAHDPAAADRPERPFSRRQVPADASLHFAAQALLAKMRSGAGTRLELEETAMALVERILASGPRRGASPTRRDREIAQRARAVVAATFHQPLTVDDVAAACEVSASHLCRAFRRATGATLWQEVQQLRVHAALGRLADGERDLTALGVGLGYAHHSHFTAAFRRQLGITPSEARRRLRR